MIYKFIELGTQDTYLEFFLTTKKEVTFQITNIEGLTEDVTLTKNQVFDLIGALLSIQHKLKGGSNG